MLRPRQTDIEMTGFTGKPAADAAGLFNGLVHALIERAARDRLQGVAVLLRVHGSGVRVERGLTLPDLDDGEVIQARCVLQNVEPQRSLIATAGLRESFEQPWRVGLRTANRVDMSHDVDGLTGGRPSRWSYGERLVGTLVVAAHANWEKCVLKLLHM